MSYTEEKLMSMKKGDILDLVRKFNYHHSIRNYSKLRKLPLAKAFMEKHKKNKGKKAPSKSSAPRVKLTTRSGARKRGNRWDIRFWYFYLSTNFE